MKKWVILFIICITGTAILCNKQGENKTEESKQFREQPVKVSLSIDKESGEIKIGEVLAPIIPELFIFDGKKATPARPTLVIQDGLELEGFSGRYPVPVGSALGSPFGGYMWGIYKNTLLETNSITQTGRKQIGFWTLESPELKTIANINIDLLGKHSVFISDEYVVYTDENRKIAKDGPFVSLVFDWDVKTKETIIVYRDGKLLRPIESAGKENIVYRLVKAKSTDDMVEWEVKDVKGQILHKGVLAFPMLGAEPHLVQYHIKVSDDPGTEKGITERLEADDSAKRMPIEGLRAELIQVSEVELKAEGVPSQCLKMVLRLVTTADTSLEFAPDQLHLEMQDGSKIREWAFLSFFPEAKATLSKGDAIRGLGMEIDGSIAEVKKFDLKPGSTAKIILPLKSGVPQEALLLFIGATKEEASSLRFVNLPPVRVQH